MRSFKYTWDISFHLSRVSTISDELRDQPQIPILLLGKWKTLVTVIHLNGKFVCIVKCQMNVYVKQPMYLQENLELLARMQKTENEPKTNQEERKMTDDMTSSERQASKYFRTIHQVLRTREHSTFWPYCRHNFCLPTCQWFIAIAVRRTRLRSSTWNQISLMVVLSVHLISIRMFTYKQDTKNIQLQQFISFPVILIVGKTLINLACEMLL